MAKEMYGFFDPTEADPRDYNDADFSRALRLLAGDGLRALGDTLRAVAGGDGLKTRVHPGGAMVRGYYYELVDDGGGAMLLQHEAAASQPRIDRVVLQLNLATQARRIALTVRKGAPAANPAAPSLTRTATVWELSLAQVRVGVGVSLLKDSDITDERADDAVCGVFGAAYVKQLIEEARGVSPAQLAAHQHSGTATDGPKIPYANITGAPTSLPANGGNAATLNGRSESYFATAAALQTTATAATAAKTAADEAAAAAAAAQQTASSKLKLVVQAAQPAADPNIIWVKT